MVASINKSLAIDFNIMMFSNRDLEDVYSPHDDAFIIKVKISNSMVIRVLVDNRSGVNVLFKDVVENMGILRSVNKEMTTIHTFE